MNHHPQTPARVIRHVSAFNAAVASGDWTSFVAGFSEEASMRFVGVPAGPFHGREAIARAYTEQPPTDTLRVVASRTDGPVDTVDYRWSTGGTGSMRLSWSEDLVDDLEVHFDLRA